MIFVEGEGEIEGEGEGGDRSESKVAWLGLGLGPAGGTSTWGSRSDRATTPRRLSEQGFCQMQSPAQSTTRGSTQASRCLLEIGL